MGYTGIETGPEVETALAWAQLWLSFSPIPLIFRGTAPTYIVH
jgi:hypothetical protein